jgi:hypothetical protein
MAAASFVVKETVLSEPVKSLSLPSVNTASNCFKCLFGGDGGRGLSESGGGRGLTRSEEAYGVASDIDFCPGALAEDSDRSSSPFRGVA